MDATRSAGLAVLPSQVALHPAVGLRAFTPAAGQLQTSYVDVSERGPTLVDEGLGGGSFCIRWKDCTAVLAYDDGARRIIGRDGFAVLLVPEAGVAGRSCGRLSTAGSPSRAGRRRTLAPRLGRRRAVEPAVQVVDLFSEVRKRTRHYQARYDVPDR